MNLHAVARRGPGTFAEWMRDRRASVSIEGALSIGLLVITFGAVVDIVLSAHLQDRVDRAAWRVAEANALQREPASSAGELDVRLNAWLGDVFDPSELSIELTSYATVDDLAAQVPATGPEARLGGAPDHFVVVHIRHTSPITTLLGDEFEAFAIVRNEVEATR